MPAPHIRPLAVALVRDGDRLLVEHGEDRSSGRRFYRAIGGGIEFMEHAADAVRREWREELGAELGEMRLLGVLENLFHYEGAPGHEVAFVFEARLADPSRFLPGPVELTESNGLTHLASWVSIEELRDGPLPLYPDGILDLYR